MLLKALVELQLRDRCRAARQASAGACTQEADKDACCLPIRGKPAAYREQNVGELRLAIHIPGTVGFLIVPFVDAATRGRRANRRSGHFASRRQRNGSGLHASSDRADADGRMSSRQLSEMRQCRYKSRRRAQ